MVNLVRFKVLSEECVAVLLVDRPLLKFYVGERLLCLPQVSLIEDCDGAGLVATASLSHPAPFGSCAAGQAVRNRIWT